MTKSTLCPALGTVDAGGGCSTDVLGRGAGLGVTVVGADGAGNDGGAVEVVLVLSALPPLMAQPMIEAFSPALRTQLSGAVGAAGQGRSGPSGTSVAAPRRRLLPGGIR